MTHRKAIQLTSKPSSVIGSGQVQTKPAYGLGGVRCRGGVSLFQALVGNVGTCRLDVKGEFQRSCTPKEESTNARHRGGAARSSDEAIERTLSKGAALSSRIDMPTRKGRSV